MREKGKTYVTVDDDMPWNKKARRVTVPARWTYAASICYSGHEQTDGVIEAGVLTLLDGTPKIAAELVASGLWEAHPLGWLVHDYLKHNRSKADIEARREKNARNGALGLASRYGLASDSQSNSVGDLSSEWEPNRSTTRDLYSATPQEKGDLSPDLPERERRSRVASKPPSKLLDVPRTVPDDEWVCQMREKYAADLADFEETLRFHAQGSYYKRLDDKQGFLEKKLISAVERRKGQGAPAFGNSRPSRPPEQTTDSSKPGWVPANMITFGDDD